MAKLDWFNALVTGAILIILIASGGDAVMGLGFDALAVSGAVSLLLALAVGYRLAGRRKR
jgi:hypothetical protein